MWTKACLKYWTILQRLLKRIWIDVNLHVITLSQHAYTRTWRIRCSPVVCGVLTGCTWRTHPLYVAYSPVVRGVLTRRTWSTHPSYMLYSPVVHSVLTCRTWCTHLSCMLYSPIVRSVLTRRTWRAQLSYMAYSPVVCGVLTRHTCVLTGRTWRTDRYSSADRTNSPRTLERAVLYIVSTRPPLSAFWNPVSYTKCSLCRWWVMKPRKKRKRSNENEK